MTWFRLLLLGTSCVLLISACGPGGEPAPQSSGSASVGLGEPRIVDTIATDLEVPWGMSLLTMGSVNSVVVTERDSARVLHIVDKQIAEIAIVDDVADDTAEGGLLGVAVHPDNNERIYLYYTTATDNRVAEYRWFDDGIGFHRVIVQGIPRASNHNGGRMIFGPDGYLYIGTGDAGNGSNSQNQQSLGGKILRVTDDGEPAPDNPFGNEVFSYGHRNVQGLAFDSQDRLWASEFGQNRLDEINLIEAGGNYGWPEAEGVSDNENFIDPTFTWTTDEASPSGIAIIDDHLLVSALRGERLWVVALDGESEPRSYFQGELGRIRSIVVIDDNTVWLTTSNRDGRGQPGDDDDRILEVTFGP